MGVISADKDGFLLAAVRPGANFSITAKGNDLWVSYTAVPESPTMLLVALTGVVGLFSRRRRRVH
jgi:hypothetical protein